MAEPTVSDDFFAGLISEIFQQHSGTYGYRRITTLIRSRGHDVNHKRIRRLMKELGLKAKYRWIKPLPPPER